MFMALTFLYMDIVSIIMLHIGLQRCWRQAPILGRQAEAPASAVPPSLAEVMPSVLTVFPPYKPSHCIQDGERELKRKVN